MKNKKVYFKINFFKKKSFFPVLFFVFFLPTQFGKHFFGNFSYINGVRVDYLSIVFYLNDIFILAFAFFNFKLIFEFFKKRKIFVFLFLIIINVFFAKNKIISLYNFFQIIKYLVVFFIGYNFFKIIKEKVFLITIFFTSLIQLFISIFQIINGHSIQGVFYFLGERLLSLSTPGVAKITVDSVEILRPYGTFSHPNSLSGFFLLLYFFVLTWKNFDKYIFLKNLNLLVFSLLIFFSFSKITIFTFLFLNIFFYFFKIFSKDKKEKINCYLCFFSKIFVFFSLSLIFLKGKGDPFSLEKRIDLMKNSFYIIYQNFLFGTGIGNYLIAQANYFSSRYFLFFNQPVHNIFLLFLSEFGIVLGGFFLVFYFSAIKKVVKENIFLFLVIVFTGFFDHYWLTLEQNKLLLFFVYGIVSSSFFIFKFKSNNSLISSSRP